jgi:hypothetical protein
MPFHLRTVCYVLCFFLTVAIVPSATAQDNTRFEFWPEVDIWKELEPNFNLLFIEAITRSRETQYTDGQTGVNLDYRWFPQKIYPLALTFRVGYSYAAQVSESPDPYKENRGIADFTPRYNIVDNLILFDRNRVEFRWVNSEYSTRYRNRLRLEYRPTINEKLVNTYVQGELVYDYAAHRWTRNYIQAGVEVPLAWFMSVEINFNRQNSVGSSAPDHVNALGMVVSFFL